MTDVKVQQCDCDAAADYLELLGDKDGAARARNPVVPTGGPLSQAFARHRQAAEKAQQEMIIALALNEYVDAEATGDDADVAYNRAIDHVVHAIRSQDHE